MANTGFEGTNGTNVTTTSEPTLAAVTISGAATITYSTAQKAHGSTSALVTHNSTSTALVTRNFDGSTGSTAFTDAYGRFYIYLTANPSATLRICQFIQTASTVSRVNITTAGKISTTDAAGTTLWTSTNVLTLSAWNRVEVHGNSPATGTNGYMEAQLFLGANSDGSTADEASGAHGGAGVLNNGITALQVGITSGTNPGIDFYLDDYNLSTSGFVGPYVASGGTTAHLLGLLGVGG